SATSRRARRTTMPVPATAEPFPRGSRSAARSRSSPRSNGGSPSASTASISSSTPPRSFRKNTSCRASGCLRARSCRCFADAIAMLIGSANIEALAARAPVMERLDGEPATCEGADVLQVTYEIASPDREAMLPAGLHPTNPPIVTWLVYRCPASPWGRFAMAQTRIECRSGLRLRAFLVSAVVDNAAAAQALASRWGFTTQPGQIELHRYYDSVRTAVE